MQTSRLIIRQQKKNPLFKLTVRFQRFSKVNNFPHWVFSLKVHPCSFVLSFFPAVILNPRKKNSKKKDSSLKFLALYHLQWKRIKKRSLNCQYEKKQRNDNKETTKNISWLPHYFLKPEERHTNVSSSQWDAVPINAAGDHHHIGSLLVFRCFLSEMSAVRAMGLMIGPYSNSKVFISISVTANNLSSYYFLTSHTMLCYILMKITSQGSFIWSLSNFL